MSRHHLPAPKIAGLRLSAFIRLYRWRLANRKAHELLAGCGIAIGVALFFGVLVADTSLIGSASQLAHAIDGSARLQLAARSPEGFSEGLVDRVRRLAGVKVAAPMLRENAAIVGPSGQDSVQLVGLTASQVALNGAATRDIAVGGLSLARGLALPSAVASDIGAQAGEAVTLLTDGSAHSVQVRLVLGNQTVGPVANSPIVVALLPLAQRISGKPRRVTQVLVEPDSGAARLVEHELRRLSAGHLNVGPADSELAVLQATAEPTSESTNLFAAISAIVGFLLALNAVLLTVPERRRFVAELREQGFGPRQVLAVLLSQAAILGWAARWSE